MALAEANCFGNRDDWPAVASRAGEPSKGDRFAPAAVRLGKPDIGSLGRVVFLGLQLLSFLMVGFDRASEYSKNIGFSQ